MFCFVLVVFILIYFYSSKKVIECYRWSIFYKMLKQAVENKCFCIFKLTQKCLCDNWNWFNFFSFPQWLIRLIENRVNIQLVAAKSRKVNHARIFLTFRRYLKFSSFWFQLFWFFSRSLIIHKIFLSADLEFRIIQVEIVCKLSDSLMRARRVEPSTELLCVSDNALSWMINYSFLSRRGTKIVQHES